MMDNKNVTDAQLNAFIDNELGSINESEYIDEVDMLSLMDENPGLKKRVSEMRHDMNMLSGVYKNIPIEGHFIEPSEKHKAASMRYVSIAASIFLVLGVISGLFVSQYLFDKSVQPVFTVVSDFNPATSDAEKILIHVSSQDENSVNAAFDKLEDIIYFSDMKKRSVKLKFIASAEGLSVLREKSPYAQRIKTISEKYKNVEFMACGIAMETAFLKEKKAVTLLPEVKKIPAALGEIMENIKNSWIYMKS
ncbi:hypothetical protein MNBD_GAMMA08-2052 [hydrothermal vent metagenome]|uniref:Uncharacterized protein n=1 Tax=hydrothermal vent metagenome TaxID=652676 RepID=A0A3B0XT79_9ZZZZ